MYNKVSYLRFNEPLSFYTNDCIVAASYLLTAGYDERRATAGIFCRGNSGYGYVRGLDG